MDISLLVTNTTSAMNCIHGIMQMDICESTRNGLICDCIIAAFPDLHSDELLQECMGLAMKVDERYSTDILSEFVPDKDEYLSTVEEDFANIYPTFDDAELAHIMSC